jgi:biotin carboxylase
MSRTILILGAGVMQLPAIRAARRIGLHVIVADGNSDAIGIAEADEFLPVDLKDHIGMAEAARAVKQRRGLHAVFTAGTDFSATVAYVAEQLGLPGTRYEVALDATDKFRMRRVLREAGVAVPDFAVVSADELNRFGCADARSRVPLPVVVKPVDSMGARGVVRADDWSRAERYAADAVRFSRSKRVVIEQYIDGPEFSLDAIVYEDDIQITGFADRHIRFPPYFIEMGHTIPTALPTADRELVETEFRRAIRALGIGPGAAKGDVKLSNGRAVVGEVAARLSGGYMSGWTYPLSSGVPLSEIGIRVALGDVPPRATPRSTRTSAERAIISIPGVLRRITGVEAARSTAGVEELFLSRGTGDAVTFPRNNVEKVGNVIAVGETRAAATLSAETAVSAVEPIVQTGNEETERFLFADAASDGSLPEEYRNWAHPELIGLAPEDGVLTRWRTLRDAGPRSRLELTIPEEAASSASRDWAYRTVRQSMDTVSAREDVRVSVGEPHDELSRVFLRAILKGGLQGARYVVESVLEFRTVVDYTPDS